MNMKRNDRKAKEQAAKSKDIMDRCEINPYCLRNAAIRLKLLRYQCAPSPYATPMKINTI